MVAKTDRVGPVWIVSHQTILVQAPPPKPQPKPKYPYTEFNDFMEGTGPDYITGPQTLLKESVIHAELFDKLFKSKKKKPTWNATVEAMNSKLTPEMQAKYDELVQGKKDLIIQAWMEKWKEAEKDLWMKPGEDDG